MKASNRKIACYIPAFRPGPEFVDCLNSVGTSSLKPFVFVVDDASDPPIKVDFHSYGLEGEVFRLDENGGHFKASNIALRELLHRGYEFVARLDADDMVLPDRFQHQVDYLEAHPECQIVASAAIIVNEVGEPTGTWPAIADRDLMQAMAKNSIVCHPTITQRSTYIEEFGPYRELRRAADYEYFMRAVVNNVIHVMDEPLLKYRVHQKSLSFTNYRGQLLARLATQRRFLNRTGIAGLLGIARTVTIMVLFTVFPRGLIGQLRAKFGMSVKKVKPA